MRVRDLLRVTADMPATVLTERVGWSGSASWFREQVAELRPLFAGKDPADRLSYEAGDQVQSDLWFPATPIPVSVQSALILPVLVMVCSISRFTSAVMVATCTTGGLLAGMWSLLSGLIEAVPHRLIWDHEAGIGGHNRLAEGVPGFVATLARKIVQLKAYDPESKGIVERANYAACAVRCDGPSPQMTFAELTTSTTGQIGSDGSIVPEFAHTLVYDISIKGADCVPASRPTSVTSDAKFTCVIDNFVDATTGKLVFTYQAGQVVGS